MEQISIGCIVGTRPEVIKMAPIIKILAQSPRVELTVIATAQHRQLLDSMLSVFNINPDIDLNIMAPDQSLSQLTGHLCLALEPVAKAKHYDIWIAQGDTTTTFVAGLTAFYHDIAFAHVEAGLRSRDLHQPFPEELNRILSSRVATWSFVPTEKEKLNLLAENIPDDKINVTGNTVIDALYWVLKQPGEVIQYPDQRMILVTSHRHENFGEPLRHICLALLAIRDRFEDVVIVYPVHPNPHVQDIVHALLDNQDRIQLIAPLPYPAFCRYMQAAYLLLTDSGGIQEEAPAIRKPVLVLRNITERPEIIDIGAGKLVGTDTETILSEVTLLLNDERAYHRMIPGKSPYGDGTAAKKITDILLNDWLKD